MECTGKISGMSIDFLSDQQELRLLINEDIRTEFDRLKDCEKLRIKIVRYRKGRSLDANAYFHVLVGKISEVLGLSTVWTKNKLIAEYGQYERLDGKLVTLPLDDKINAYDVDFIHLQPTSQTQTNSSGILFRVNLVMRGTHTYNTEEMSHLIDGTVAEAKELGIDTATPEQIAEMEEIWGLKFEKHNAD